MNDPERAAGKNHLSCDEMEHLLAKAACRGAQQVLKEISLDNGRKAARDIRELRDLLAAWRAAKRTALQTAVRLLTTLLLLAMLIGLAIKIKFWGE